MAEAEIEVDSDDEPWKLAYGVTDSTKQYAAWRNNLAQNPEYNTDSDSDESDSDSDDSDADSPASAATVMPQPQLRPSHSSPRKRIQRPADYPLVSPLYDRIRNATHDTANESIESFVLTREFFNRDLHFTNPRDILNLRETSRELYLRTIIQNFDTLEFRFTRIKSFRYFLLRFGLSSATDLWNSRAWNHFRRWATRDPVAMHFIQLGTPYLLDRIQHLDLSFPYDEPDWDARIRGSIEWELFGDNPCLFTGLRTLTVSPKMLGYLKHCQLNNAFKAWKRVPIVRMTELPEILNIDNIYSIIPNDQFTLNVRENLRYVHNIGGIFTLLNCSKREMRLCAQYNRDTPSYDRLLWCTSQEMALVFPLLSITQQQHVAYGIQQCHARKIFMSRVQFSWKKHRWDCILRPYLITDIQSQLEIRPDIFPNLQQVELFECGAVDLFLAGCIPHLSHVTFIVNNQRVDLTDVQTQQEILKRARVLFMDYLLFCMFTNRVYRRYSTLPYPMAVEPFPLIIQEPMDADDAALDAAAAAGDI